MMNGNAMSPSEVQLLKIRTPGLGENMADIDVRVYTATDLVQRLKSYI